MLVVIIAAFDTTVGLIVATGTNADVLILHPLTLMLGLIAATDTDTNASGFKSCHWHQQSSLFNFYMCIVIHCKKM